MARDDFPKKVKTKLAERVAHRCSNPHCRRPTIGPSVDPDGSISTGDAAHISAASPGGPRFDSTLSEEQRASIENGIWLCVACARTIDRDVAAYSADALRQWKLDSEREAGAAREGHVSPRSVPCPYCDPGKKANLERLWQSGRTARADESARKAAAKQGSLLNDLVNRGMMGSSIEISGALDILLDHSRTLVEGLVDAAAELLPLLCSPHRADLRGSVAEEIRVSCEAGERAAADRLRDMLSRDTFRGMGGGSSFESSLHSRYDGQLRSTRGKLERAFLRAETGLAAPPA